MGRLTNVQARRVDLPDSAPDPVARYAYDAAGNLVTVTAGNGVAHRYRYDRMNRLTNLVVALGALALAQFDYRLDAAGHRTNLVEQVNTVARQHAWRYDRLHRLTHETITPGGAGNLPAPVGGSPTGTMAYAYDRVGNRLARASTLAPLPPQTLTYDANDRLTTDTYDPNGNTTTGRALPAAPSMTCAYDWANRLTNAVVGGKTIALTYNADGHRVKKVVTEGGVVTTTTWLVDDRNPTGYAQVLEERQTRSADPDSQTRFYVYGLDLLRQRRAVGEGVAEETRYFGHDGHGSVRFLTDAAGTVTDTYAYDAYGTLLDTWHAAAPTPNLYHYAGEEWDFDLGLSYNRARYLNPDKGRFWTLDPFEGHSTDPLSLHKYLYAHADPVNRIDPSGNAAEATAIGQVGVANIQFTIQTAYLRTAAFATAVALTDYFSRQQLFLFHVTDATIVRIAQTYNGGAFRAASSSKPMFFATTSTHVASLLLYGVGYPIAIYAGLFDKPTAAGIAAFAADLGVPYASLPATLKKPSGKPVIILTSKKNSIAAKIWFNGGINVQGVGYVPLLYSTFTTAPGEMVRPQNYKLIPLP